MPLLVQGTPGPAARSTANATGAACALPTTPACVTRDGGWGPTAASGTAPAQTALPVSGRASAAASRPASMGRATAAAASAGLVSGSLLSGAPSAVHAGGSALARRVYTQAASQRPARLRSLVAIAGYRGAICDLPNGAAPNKGSPVGMNVAGPAYYSSQWIFVSAGLLGCWAAVPVAVAVVVPASVLLCALNLKGLSPAAVPASLPCTCGPVLAGSAAGRAPRPQLPQPCRRRWT
jgi:hypothetical protein